MPTQREDSRKDWNSTSTTQDINSGSLQRIADATEKMAAGYDKLRYDLDYYQRRAKELNIANHLCRRRMAALRGVITKLKRKMVVS